MSTNNEGHVYGELESLRHDALRKPYKEGMEKIMGMGYSMDDVLQHFPAFVGHFSIARMLQMHEYFKMTLDVAGHIAEVGVYKGAGSILFGKLVRLFEPNGMTQVHGFDWFKGMELTEQEKRFVKEGSYQEPKDRVEQLVKAQQLDGIVRIHELDATKDFPAFFAKYDHLQFKLVFLDAGSYMVTKPSIEALWPRITPGGIMVLDQFNHEMSPGETKAVKELLPNAKIKTLPWGWMPTAYIVKE